jgi:hypothetical protein
LKHSNWKDNAELIGIVAIAASLIFVGLELRQSTLATRITARDLATQGIIDQMGDIIDSEVLAVAYAKGWGNEPLTDLETSQLSIYHMRRWWNFERIYYLYREGVISEQEWKGLRNAIVESLSESHRQPARDAWNTARRFMSEDFVRYVETEAKLIE